MIVILPTGLRGYKVLQEVDDCETRECVDGVHRDTIERTTEKDDQKIQDSLLNAVVYSSVTVQDPNFGLFAP